MIDPSARIVHYNTERGPHVLEQSHRVLPSKDINQGKGPIHGKDKRVTKRTMWCINNKVRYSVVNIILLILSFILFLIFATVTYFSEAYDFFGFTLMFSRGAALAIIVFTILAMFFVSYDVTSY